MNVPTWVIGLVCGLIGALLGLAVKWGVQQTQVKHLEADLERLRGAIEKLTEKVDRLSTELATHRGAQTTGKHPAATN